MLLNKIKNLDKIYYAGDFDPEGLQIADKLKDLYKDKVEFMLYDEKYYEKIISDKELDLKRIGKLKSIKDKDLKDISNYLIKYKKAAYQELLIDEYKQYIRQQVKG